MSNILYSLLLMMALLCCSCRGCMEGKDVIFIKNQTPQRIYTSVGWGDVGLNIFPDTSLTVQKPFLIEMLPDATETLIWVPSISDAFDQVNGILSVYIFDAHLTDSLGWKGIKDQNLVLKRYDLKESDIGVGDTLVVKL